MVTTVRKPRKNKAAQIEVTHRVYGPGNVVERRATENGSDALVVRFPDAQTRTLLAAERYWVDLNLASIPISGPARKGKPEAKDEEMEAVEVAAD